MTDDQVEQMRWLIAKDILCAFITAKVSMAQADMPEIAVKRAGELVAQLKKVKA